MHHRHIQDNQMIVDVVLILVVVIIVKTVAIITEEGEDGVM